jgi:putative oxidoreductase
MDGPWRFSDNSTPDTRRLRTMRMRLLRTERDLSAFFLRLTLAVVLFPHGAQKAFGWFGGLGLDPALRHFQNDLGIPLAFGLFAVVAEFLGAIGLFIGFFTRVVAFAVAVEMVVAVNLVHLEFGFFMNWMNLQRGGGFEYHILVIGICFALMLKGGGTWSIDRAITRQKHKGDIYLPIH